MRGPACPGSEGGRVLARVSGRGYGVRGQYWGWVYSEVKMALIRARFLGFCHRGPIWLVT